MKRSDGGGEGSNRDKRRSVKLTERNVRAVSPGEKQIVIWDDSLPGFLLTVSPGGTKAFNFDYRFCGRRRRVTIGRFGAWTVEGARKEARQLRVRVDKGEDPKHQEDISSKTVRDAWQRFESDYLPELAAGTRYDFGKYAENWILPRLGSMPVLTVAFGDIERLHKAYSKKAPYAANRCVEFIRRLFNLAIRWGWCDTNPAAFIEFNRELNRQTYLDRAQVDALLNALAGGNRNSDVADFLRFLILTGCRKGEAAAMTWDQIDFKAGAWTKPAHSVKSRREHRVPLNDQALAILKRRKGDVGLVFSLPNGKPIRDPRKVLWAACKRAGVPLVRIHDLRHTFASLLASGGTSLPVIGALLDHSNPQTTSRYAHLFDDVLRDAAQKAGGPNK
jgi:integrase